MNEDSFFSINKLVEFGMSIAVAQQMVKTMNDAMANMKVPGTFQSNPLQQKNFYAVINGNQLGPMSESEMTRLIIEGNITKETFVWFPGLPSWNLAGSINDVNKLFGLIPPQPPKL